MLSLQNVEHPESKNEKGEWRPAIPLAKRAVVNGRA
jgi:hypothetical protein